MRRKSTRSVEASVATPEKTPRRTTRRGRKSPSPEPAAPAENDAKSDSDNSEAETTRRNRRTPSHNKSGDERPKRGRARKEVPLVEISEEKEEQHQSDVEQPTTQDVGEEVEEERPASVEAETESGDAVIVEATATKEVTPVVVAQEEEEHIVAENDKEEQLPNLPLNESNEEIHEIETNAAKRDVSNKKQRSRSQSSESSRQQKSRSPSSSNSESEPVQVEKVNERESPVEAEAGKDSHIEHQAEPASERMEVDSSLEIENRRTSVPEQSKPEKSSVDEHKGSDRHSSRSPRKDSYHRKEDRRSSDKEKTSKPEVKISKANEPNEKSAKEVDSKKPIQRKRKWLSRKPSDTKPSVITISTDSLKNIISDVRPVPLADVRLESSSEENEDVISIEPEGPRMKEKSSSKSSERDSRMLQGDDDEPKPQRPDRKSSATRLEKQNSVEQPLIAPLVPSSRNRKVSIVELDVIANRVQRPPSPAKRSFSNILYITNLVRPFTVLQLKGLLARTGKIVENGFWIDKIKSKCFVKYETEDEAVETRHALHGVRWPQSNPKCLNVEFGSPNEMEKAIISTLDESSGRIPVDSGRSDGKDFGWSKADVNKTDFEERGRNVNRPVREWDVGKTKEEFDRDRSRDRRDEQRDGRVMVRGADVRAERNGRGDVREDGRQRSPDFNRDRKRMSRSVSPGRRHKKKENDPPLRLLDDLFRKTIATPCIYWLPLTAEQITIKEEQRRKNIQEHEKRLEEIRKRREGERRAEKERDKEREKSRNERRERSRERRRSKSRSKSRSRGDDRRRYR